MTRGGTDPSGPPPASWSAGACSRFPEAELAPPETVAYLMKPVKQSELLDAILTALGQSLRHGEVPPPRPAAEERRQPLRVLLAEDNPVNQKLAVRLLEKRGHSVVVAAEGAQPKDGSMEVAQTGTTDEFGHVRLGGIGYALEREIEQRTGYETRATVLGHVQRGGTPTAFDRVLATRFGVAAMEAVLGGSFGQMVALQANEIVLVPLAEALSEPKTLDPKLFELAQIFFG